MANPHTPPGLQGLNLNAQQLQGVLAFSAQAAQAARISQLQADQDILDQAKEEKRAAERLRYCFMLRNRCKDSFLHLNHLYSV